VLHEPSQDHTAVFSQHSTSLEFSKFYDLKRAILWLLVQMTSLHPFHGITVLTIFAEMFQIALKYYLMFLLKEHIMLAIVSPLTRKVFFLNFYASWCRPIFTCEGTETLEKKTSRFVTTLVRFLPYTDFRNKIWLWYTVIRIHHNHEQQQ
jgi:hypothetical protein